MKPLLHRPFAFWLPAFGLLFLLWAWVDSCYHATGLDIDHTLGKGHSFISASHSGSRLRFSHEHLAGMSSMRSEPASFWRNPLIYQSYWWFPLPRVHSSQHAYPSSKFPGTLFTRNRSSLEIPHWTLILLYLTCWGAVLRRKKHRSRKQLEAIAAQAA